jgi:hypothetical protein
VAPELAMQLLPDALPVGLHGVESLMYFFCQCGYAVAVPWQRVDSTPCIT